MENVLKLKSKSIYKDINMLEIIYPLSFDSAIFNRLCFRIIPTNADQVKGAVEKYLNQLNIFIDTKIDASDKELDNLLQKLGFRKVCMQIQLSLPRSHYLTDPSAVEPLSVLQMNNIDIHSHCNNFLFDRFSLDPRIPKLQRDNLYTTWIKNTLSNPSILKVSRGNNFISFKKNLDSLKLDLTSVLDKERGIGSALLKDIQAYAKQHDFKKIEVITETENIAAVKFYLKNGFEVDCFYSCFHYIN